MGRTSSQPACAGRYAPARPAHQCRSGRRPCTPMRPEVAVGASLPQPTSRYQSSTLRCYWRFESVRVRFRAEPALARVDLAIVRV